MFSVQYVFDLELPESFKPSNNDGEVAEWRQGLVYLREAGCSETGPGCGYDRSVINIFLSKPVYCVSIHKSKE